MSVAADVPHQLFAWREDVEDGLRLGFTGVSAGNLALHTGDEQGGVLDRRARLEREMRVRGGSLRFMDQRHSSTVVPVSADDCAQTPVADGILSPDGTDPLAVMVADCMPVLLAGRLRSGHARSGHARSGSTPAGPSQGGWATAAVHAGRAGLLAGILPRAVEQLRSAGASELQAWIGPSICGRCYEVPEAMLQAAASVLPECAATTRHGTPALDLPAGAVAQLEARGVRTWQTGICTLEDQRFYSYRGGASRERFAGIVWTGGVDGSA